MTTFIKTKFKISDDQTNIGKYIVAANITEYHIKSKSMLDSQDLDIKIIQVRINCC